MSIIRTKTKNNPFVVLDKSCVCNTKLSWAAKGLHTYLMGLPEHWEINTYDLTHRSKNGRDAVRSLLSELETFGYLVRDTIREQGKFVRTEYVVYETPQPPAPDNPALVMPGPEKPGTVSPGLDNPTQVNIKPTFIKNFLSFVF